MLRRSKSEIPQEFLQRIAKSGRQFKVSCPGGSQSPYHFDRLFSRSSRAHGCRVAYRGVSAHAVQLCCRRLRFYFSNSVFVSAWSCAGPLSAHKLIRGFHFSRLVDSGDLHASGPSLSPLADGRLHRAAGGLVASLCARRAN